MRFTKMLLVTALLSIGLVFGVLGFAAAQSETDHIRWDIEAISVDENGLLIFDKGGAAYAMADDESAIKITGSGTFGPGMDDPVAGGGDWATFDRLGVPTAAGTYTITGLVSWTEAPGSDPTDPTTFKDLILEAEGLEQSDYRAGLVVFSVAFADELGNPTDIGSLVVSCHLPTDSPISIFEGVTVTKGYVGYWNRVQPLPEQGFSFTIFFNVHG